MAEETTNPTAPANGGDNAAQAAPAPAEPANTNVMAAPEPTASEPAPAPEKCRARDNTTPILLALSGLAILIIAAWALLDSRATTIVKRTDGIAAAVGAPVDYVEIADIQNRKAEKAEHAQAAKEHKAIAADVKETKKDVAAIKTAVASAPPEKKKSGWPNGGWASPPKPKATTGNACINLKREYNSLIDSLSGDDRKKVCRAADKIVSMFQSNPKSLEGCMDRAGLQQVKSQLEICTEEDGYITEARAGSFSYQCRQKKVLGVKIPGDVCKAISKPVPAIVKVYAVSPVCAAVSGDCAKIVDRHLGLDSLGRSLKVGNPSTTSGKIVDPGPPPAGDNAMPGDFTTLPTAGINDAGNGTGWVSVLPKGDGIVSITTANVTEVVLPDASSVANINTLVGTPPSSDQAAGSEEIGVGVSLQIADPGTPAVSGGSLQIQ